MTEFWVSQSNKWCEYCKCWLKDTAQSWAVHERGMGHKENVARKLREMRQKQDKEKKDEAQLKSAMEKVEREAQQQFEADKAAAAEAERARLGEWEFKAETGYWYNAVHRWYYDTKSRMYYGGNPVQWTAAPAGLPREARYEVMHAPKPAAAAPPPPGGAAAAEPRGGGGGAQPAAARQYAVAGGRVVASHPLADVGGYQLHSVAGAVGGAKGVGLASARGGGGSGGKRKAGEEKELSKEDREFLARREAARQRVQQRTAASFGLT